KLPAHERQCCPTVRQMSGGLAERAVIAAVHQSEPTSRVVADRGDLLLRPLSSRNTRLHKDRIACSSSDASAERSVTAWVPASTASGMPSPSAAGQCCHR